MERISKLRSEHCRLFNDAVSHVVEFEGNTGKMRLCEKDTPENLSCCVPAEDSSVGAYVGLY